MRQETLELINIYNKHGHIIVGCDFDNTIFPLNPHRAGICCTVRDLLLSIKNEITLCLYTIASPQELVYKEFIMDHHYELKPAYVNKSPVKFEGSTKPYFNILLDDKAGLNETIEILNEFKIYIKQNKL